MRSIDIISQKCNSIVEDLYGDDRCKPYIVISQMRGKGYVITLIHNEEDGAFDYRQSEFLTLDTKLDEVIETLYNRTM